MNVGADDGSGVSPPDSRLTSSVVEVVVVVTGLAEGLPVSPSLVGLPVTGLLVGLPEGLAVGLRVSPSFVGLKVVGLLEGLSVCLTLVSSTVTPSLYDIDGLPLGDPDGL